MTNFRNKYENWVWKEVQRMTVDSRTTTECRMKRNRVDIGRSKLVRVLERNHEETHASYELAPNLTGRLGECLQLNIRKHLSCCTKMLVGKCGYRPRKSSAHSFISCDMTDFVPVSSCCYSSCGLMLHRYKSFVVQKFEDVIWSILSSFRFLLSF
jgi:hypothetical protein